MMTPLSRFIPALGLSLFSLSLSYSASAQVTPKASYGLPANVIQEALELESENFFENRDFGSQIELILGPGALGNASFPELEISRDAFLVDLLYRDLLDQQVASDPIIRTPDLYNPYSTSLRLNPRYRALPSEVVPVVDPINGTEFFFDPLP
jgi:hypothetical protein